MRAVAVAMACAVLACACSVGSGKNGLGTAATIGGFDSEDESAGTLGAMEGDDGATSAGTLGAMEGGDESDGDGSDDGNDDAPTNPNEMCNGIDDDANGMIDDGLGVLHCGMGVCENEAPACDAGVPGNCVPLPGSAEVCNSIDDDCDGSVDEDLTSSCSTACGSGTETCVGGVPECDAPQPATESCNYIDDDCNGSLDDGLPGCRIGVHRSYNGVSNEHFYTTSLPEAQSGNFQLEAQDYYFVYAAAQTGLVGFYRCLKTNGKHFYTQSSTCEGQTVEGALGWVEDTDTPETVPLFRLYSGSAGNHFYTTSTAERDSAIAGGYIDEGTAAYVFTE